MDSSSDAVETRIVNELSYPIVVAERVRAAADEAVSFKLECSEIGKHADRLTQMLRTLVRLAAAPPLYERPVRRVVAEVSRSLERALALARRCKHRSFLRRVVRITAAADFRKVFALLESSAGDMKWLVGIFDGDGGGGIVSLPPIASNDPIVSWVWSSVAAIQMSSSAADRVDAANQLASLAHDNDRNKKIIVEEGGVPPLLRLLKEASSPEAQIAAAAALCHLANNCDRVRAIVDAAGVPTIVQVLGDSPVKVQTNAASLVARMAENDRVAQDDFAVENAIRPLVTLLSFQAAEAPSGIHSIHSIVQINKELEKSFASRVYKSSNSNSSGGSSRRDRENEKPEFKLMLKTSCAEALWKLARGSVANSQRITETKGLLCLAKLVETETGELQYNSLMALSEITAAAESNPDLRRAAFKTNSPAAKAVVDQLLRLAGSSDSPSLQVPAVKSIGSLARTFPAREAARVVGPLVRSLASRDADVATEAAVALGKFVGPENFLCAEHSRAVVELEGVPPMLRLLRLGERSLFEGLVLLCHVALHNGGNDALDRARVLTALEGADRAVIAQHPGLKDLVPKAVYYLNLYHSGGGGHSQRFSFVP